MSLNLAINEGNMQVIAAHLQHKLEDKMRQKDTLKFPKNDEKNEGVRTALFECFSSFLFYL